MIIAGLWALTDETGEHACDMALPGDGVTAPLAPDDLHLRVLRPGGVFVLTFSNRWFPGKAVNVWSELHEFERVGMVTQWLQQAGFGRLNTFSSRGWPRPKSDPHYGQITVSDPVYAAWGFRPT